MSDSPTPTANWLLVTLSPTFKTHFLRFGSYYSVYLINTDLKIPPSALVPYTIVLFSLNFRILSDVLSQYSDSK